MSQEELMTMLQTLEATLGVELTDTEIGDLRNAIYGLFGKRALLAETVANIKPDDTLYDLYYAAGMLTMWQTAEVWLTIAEQNGLVEGKDYEFLEPDAALFIDERATGDLVDGPTEFKLTTAMLPYMHFSPRDYGGIYGVQPPVAYDCLWFETKASTADMQAIAFHADTENGLMPDDWLQGSGAFRVSYVKGDSFIRPPPFSLYKQQFPGLTFCQTFPTFDARPEGWMYWSVYIPPLRAEVKPGTTDLAAYALLPPTPVSIDGRIYCQGWKPNRQTCTVGVPDPEPVPMFPLRFDMVIVKILHNVGLNIGPYDFKPVIEELPPPDPGDWHPPPV